jgi:hypothetical protein
MFVQGLQFPVVYRSDFICAILPIAPHMDYHSTIEFSMQELLPVMESDMALARLFGIRVVDVCAQPFAVVWCAA